MAARKKAPKKKAKAKKAAKKVKKPARAARKPAPKARAKKKAAPKKKVATRKKVVAKATAAPQISPSTPITNPLDSVARKIVRAAQASPGDFDIADLYDKNAVSIEPGGGEPSKGIQALQEKLAFWESIQEHTSWKTRNIFIHANTICIEWDAKVKMRDGRTVKFNEIAIHEIKDGKIVSERYYYDPKVLAPPEPEIVVPAGPTPDPERAVRPEDPSSPAVDPLDL